MNLDEKLHAYVDGELPPEEAQKFASELEVNDELRARYERALVARDISEGLLEADMREVLEKARAPKRLYWIYGAVAASVITVLGLFLFRSMLPGEQDYYAANYTEPLWPGTRGGEGELAEILSEFRNGEDIQLVKSKLMQMDSITYEMKSYWISEMFLAQEELDSALFYSPSLPENHRKYERVLLNLKLIENSNRHK